MAFTITESATRDNVPVGTYEVLIYAPSFRATQAGAPYISIPCIIRNDVVQPEQDRRIFYSLWPRVTPTPADPEGYSIKQISQLAQACGIDMGKEYASLQDWLNDLHGKCFRITINGYDERGYAKYGWHDKTQHPVCNHRAQSQQQAAPAPAPAPGLTPITDEDVPF